MSVFYQPFGLPVFIPTASCGVFNGIFHKAIGVQLGISDRTVQGHLAKIFSKLQASSRTEAVMRAVSMGWLPPDLGDLRQNDYG
jgi:hypothetical protein